MKIILPPDMAEALAAMSDAEASALFRRLVGQAVERQREISRKRSEAGRKGNMLRWHGEVKLDDKSNRKTSQTSQKENEQEKEKNQKNKEQEKEVLSERVDKTARRFVPPQLEEIRAFVLEKNYEIDPDVFYHYYEANGWRIGRTPMKNWRAAVAQWNARERHQNKHQDRYADNQPNTAPGTRANGRPTTAELTIESAAQAIANLQQRRANPLADVLGW